jgi:uncharacterized membrane protein YhaH (DUF805 family)
MYWYKRVILYYFQFTGRSRRKEFWMFTLFNIPFLLTAILLDNLLGTTSPNLELPIGFLTISYYCFIFIPSMSVSIRRLHDIGKSSWYYIISFIPFVGGILMIVAMCIEGQPHTNQWGTNPKEEED